MKTKINNKSSVTIIETRDIIPRCKMDYTWINETNVKSELAKEDLRRYYWRPYKQYYIQIITEVRLMKTIEKMQLCFVELDFYRVSSESRNKISENM